MEMLQKIRLLNKIGVFNWARWLNCWKNSFDKNKTGFYQQFVNKGDLCFDIGANIGQKVELFLRLGARVVAVEPQKDCFNFLKRLYGIHPNVILVNKAVDACAGLHKKIYLCEANALSSLSPEFIKRGQEEGDWREYRWDKNDDVETTTLDSLIVEFGIPRFCKIDVEGYEYNVIKGLSRCIPCVSFEAFPLTKNNTVRIIDHLSSLGAVEVNWALDPTFAKGKILMANPSWQSPDVAKTVLSGETDFNGDIFVKTFMQDSSR